MTDKVIFITATGNWQVPLDWNNSANKVEALGPGGSGATGATFGNAGGGGGAYATRSNITLVPNALIPVVVGTGGSQTDTNFNSGSVIAKAGTNASGSTQGTGGLASQCTPSTGAHSGGDGGVGVTGGSGVILTGSGGGGAAGPAGDGLPGSVGQRSNTISLTSGAGGNSGSGALGGAVSTGANPGAAGSGTWVSNPGAVSIGPGGGGSGGGDAAGPTGHVGGDGGLYGAGSGGGCNSNANFAAGAAQPGVIVITYTPATTPVTESVWKQYREILRRGQRPRKRLFLRGAIPLLKLRHIIPYHVPPITTYNPAGAGETDIRQKEPQLTKLRNTLTQLRIISPSLEE